MGRVRRYKKIKACDPFSKKKPTDPKALLYDESPEDFEQRQKNKSTKLKKRLEVVETLSTPIHTDRFEPTASFSSSSAGKEEDIHFNDKMLQEQAKRELQIQNSAYLSSSRGNDGLRKTQDPKINLTLHPGESLKKFSKRVELEKRRILMEEIPKQSNTAVKRKEKFKLVKLKRKLKKSGKSESLDEDVMEFGSRADGYIRASDRQESRSEFLHHEHIPFGETAHAPPNLKSYIQQLDKQKAKKLKGTTQLGFASKEVDGEGINEQLSSNKLIHDEDEVIGDEETLKGSKKRKRKVDWDKFDADDTGNNTDLLSNGLLASMDRLPPNPLEYLNQQKKMKQQNNPASLFSQGELERQRKEIQEKYKQIKEKRRTQTSI